MKCDNVLWIRGNCDGSDCLSGIARVTYKGAIHMDILNCFHVIYLVGYGGPKLISRLLYSVSSILAQMLGELALEDLDTLTLFVFSILDRLSLHILIPDLLSSLRVQSLGFSLDKCFTLNYAPWFI